MVRSAPSARVSNQEWLGASFETRSKATAPQDEGGVGLYGCIPALQETIFLSCRYDFHANALIWIQSISGSGEATWR